MSIVNLNLPSDGTTAEVADYNTPITTLKDDYNGNIDNTNIAAAAAISFDKISGGSTSALAALASYTVTWTATGGTPSIGSGTKAGSFVQIGKMVFFSINLVIAGDTSLGSTTDWAFSLPVTAKTGFPSGTPIGNVYILDSGTAEYMGQLRLASTTTARAYMANASGTYVTTGTALAFNVPVAWAANDQIRMWGSYEAA